MKYLLRKVWVLAYRLHLTDLLSDRMFVHLLFIFRLQKKLHLDNPVDFNEKLQWLKLYYHDPLMIQCADKYAVRKFVEERIGGDYLNKCLGVYERAEDVNFEVLPKSFVLKATHGSGWNFVCPEKVKLDVSRARKLMRKWLKSDFSKVGREWQYHAIKPRIVCEAFLKDEVTKELRDYKVFTFDGICKYIWVDYHRVDVDGKTRHYRNIYDCDWHWRPNTGSLFPNGDGEDVARPKCLTEMLTCAEKLGKGFPQCRVDFYVVNDKLYFGELTFSCGNGINEFFPQAFADELGSYIKLREKKF